MGNKSSSSSRTDGPRSRPSIRPRGKWMCTWPDRGGGNQSIDIEIGRSICRGSSRCFDGFYRQLCECFFRCLTSLLDTLSLTPSLLPLLACCTCSVNGRIFRSFYFTCLNAIEESLSFPYVTFTMIIICYKAFLKQTFIVKLISHVLHYFVSSLLAN